MLKKIVAILMLLVYVPAIAGVGFSSHFCGGELRSINIFSLSKQSCCTDEPEDDGCCSDQIEFVKLEKDQLENSNRYSVKQLSFIADKPFETSAINFSISLKRVENIIPKPAPPLIYLNIPILYCTFLI